MAKYLETNLHTGSAKPSKPDSRPTKGPSSGNVGAYNPSAAAKHLKGQDTCIPDNNGPVMLGGFGKNHE